MYKSLKLIVALFVLLFISNFWGVISTAFGVNLHGLIPKVYAESESNISGVAATGSNHSLLLQKDSTVKAWGYNSDGQLGTGNTTSCITPTTISGLSGVKQVVAGGNFSLALMQNGTVKAWGSNFLGQLGMGNTYTYNSPTTIPNLAGVKQLSCGGQYTLALMDDGTVKSWGCNSYGQLGCGGGGNSSTPITIPGLSNVKQVIAGNDFSYALMSDGTVKAWGNNSIGQLGMGSYGGSPYYLPTLIPNLTGVQQISCGFDHTLVLMNNGTVKGWGHSYFYELGAYSYSTNNSFITPINLNISNIKQVMCGHDYSMFLLSDGTVKVCGYNGNGELGLGNNSSPYSVPTIITNLQNVNYLVSSANSSYNLALMSDGSVKAWGVNSSSQLGFSTTPPQNYSPTTIQGLIYNNKPQVSIISPISGQVMNSSYNFIPSAYVKDFDNERLTCGIWVDSGTKNVQTEIGTTESKAVTFPQIDLNVLSEGKHTLFISVDDGLVSATYSTVFYLDNKGSTPQITNATSTDHSVSVDGTAYDELGGFDDKALKYSIGNDTSTWLTQSNEKTNASITPLLTTISNYNCKRLVRLDNGWLVYSILDSKNRKVNFYFSTNNGISWDLLCYINNVSGTDNSSICSYNNRIYYLASPTNLSENVWTFDPISLLPGSDITSSSYVVESSQGPYYGCSITTDSNGYIHASWNCVYSNTGSVHYGKSVDGGKTWEIKIISNGSFSNPCILIKRDNKPIIICSYSSSSIYTFSPDVNNNWSQYGTAYSSSANYYAYFPYAIIDKNGDIHVVWQGTDATNNYLNIFYSKSIDNGLTWNTLKLTNEAKGQSNPVITYDSKNCMYVLWTGTDSNNSYTNIKRLVFADGKWSNPINFTNNTTANAYNVSVLDSYSDFLDCLYAYTDDQSKSTRFMGIYSVKASYTTPAELDANTKYTIKLEAKDKAGNISSVTKDIYTNAEIPVINSKSITPISIELSINDRNPKDTLYQISMGDMYIGSSGELTSSPSWITLTDKKIIVHGLSPSDKYLFQAKARNYEGIETEYSNIVSCNTFKGVPEVPDNTKIISAEDKITVTWNTVEDTTGYEIEVDGTIIDNGTSTTYEGDFEPGTNHTFRVRARNEVGAGDWSSVLEGTAKYGLPTAPANLTTTPAGTSINVSWDAVTGATGYDLEIDGQVKNVGLKTSYTNTGLRPATQHTYRVRSRNVQGPGEWSSLETVMTTGGTPGKPSNFTYTITNTTATINWDAAPDAETYDIVEVVNGQDGRVVDNGSPTTCEKRGLAPSSTHTYKIRAVNSIGAGEWSDPFTITTFLLDTPSDIVTIESDTSIFLGWSAVKNATSYVISINGTETITTTNVYTFTKLTPETKYTFRVKAVGVNGESRYSDPITTTTTPIKPAVPTNVSATVSDTLITVTWDKVENAEGYDVELDGIIMEDDDDNIYIHDGLESDTMHTYRVRARNSAIEGDWSELQYIKTLPGKPDVPKNIEIRSTTTGATLTWQGKDSDLSYDIKIYDGTKKEDGTPTDPVIIENIAKKTYTHRRTSLGQEYTYWIRTRNKEGVSDWSGKIINNAIKAKCTKNKTVDLGLTAKDVTDFSAYTMVVTYNASAVDVIDLSTLTGQYETVPGRIEGTDIEITDFTPGKITFKCDKVVNPGEAWTGVINSIKFKAKATGGTTITYTVLCKSGEIVD